jgi:TonB family protein
VIGRYSEPPQHRGPLPVEVLERDAFAFSRYVGAEFPPIALSARVFRDVKVRLTVDRATGAVTDATVVEGQALLNHAALGAAKQWRFVAGTAPSEPFDVTFRFELKCAAR